MKEQFTNSIEEEKDKKSQTPEQYLE